MERLEKALLVVLFAGVFQTAGAEVPPDVKRALASRDYDVAVSWLEENSADPDAAFELGRLYRLGRGVPRDESRAAVLFERAAAAGNVEAQYLLGKYHDRQGDHGEARRWMAQAAAAGHDGAARWLAHQQPEVASAGDIFTLIREAAPAPTGVVPAADLARRDDAGRTPLIVAAGTGATAWTEYLLGSGADPNVRDRDGATALHVALAARQVAVAGLLLDAGADPALTTDEGNSALHLAVSAGEATLASRMLKRGADPDRVNEAGWSPRMLAKRSDDPTLHRLFGVSATERSRSVAVSGDDALRLAQQAARQGDGAALGRLLKPAGKVDVHELETIFFEAAVRGRTRVLDVLTASGIDVNATDAQGLSALSLTAKAGCAECVDLLVGRGADTGARDARGRTPLILAAREGRIEAVRALVGTGAPANQVDALQRNALWWACRSGHGDLAQQLLDLGVPVRADAEGVGPLHLAAGNDDAVLVTALSRAAPVDPRTTDGSRPLMIAARAGADSAVDALLAAGAEVDARNDAGDTALIVAVRAGRLSVSERLIDAGANPNRRNDRFESAASLMEARSEPGWEELRESSKKGLSSLFGSISS
ncbi:MAG: ankyrin repeat domain-containing protein [Pseudomonadales bacterium]|jgi:ankyrin repeat protein